MYRELPFETRQRMDAAMLEAMKLGQSKAPDFAQLEFAAAWEYLHGFRGAGKTSAYGPLEQAAIADANSHELRGFIVGWAMCKAWMESQRGDV